MSLASRLACSATNYPSRGCCDRRVLLPPDGLVVRERIRLNEPRRIGRIPRAVLVLPLVLIACHRLEPTRHVLGDGDHHAPILRRRPRHVRQPEDLTRVRIDPPEPAERLERRIRPEPVDLRLPVLVPIGFRGHRDVQAHIQRKLPLIAHDVLVDERLVEIRVEPQGLDPQRNRWYRVLRVEDAIAIEIVRRQRRRAGRRAEARDRVTAAHQLPVHACEARPHDVLRVARDQECSAHARGDLDAVLHREIAQPVEAFHEVGAETDRRGQPRDRPPGVLDVHAVVVVTP